MKCPYCKSKELWRMRPQRWMQFTPGSMKNMRCSNCGAEFTKWLEFITMRHSKAKRLTVLWHAVLWILLCLSLGFAIPALLAAMSY